MEAAGGAQVHIVVSKIRGTICGGPHNKDYIVYLGLYWGPPILGNYHMNTQGRRQNNTRGLSDFLSGFKHLGLTA